MKIFIHTNIYIRAQIAGKWESVDIGDPRLSAPQVLDWLAGLEGAGAYRAIDAVREAKREEIDP